VLASTCIEARRARKFGSRAGIAALQYTIMQLYFSTSEQHVVFFVGTSVANSDCKFVLPTLLVTRCGIGVESTFASEAAINTFRTAV
jgi:hypothetical protein